MSNPIHIGQILVEHGILNAQQVFEILEAQRQKGTPFGVLAERMFEVTLESVERAWVQQYCRMTGTIDLSKQRIDPQVLGLVNRRQAWQFEMMPLHYASPGGELVMAATDQRLARAVAFAANRLGAVVYFRVAQADQMRKFLQTYYPMPEIPQTIKNQARSLAWSVPTTKPA